MTKGHHVLDAIQALEFVRQRHNLPNGDLDRTKRQRYFLTAAFRQVASAGTLVDPSKLHNLISAVDRSLYVDSGFDITTLVQQMANLSANNIQGKAIPYERFDMTSVGSVEIVDPARVKAFVDRLINGSSSSPSPLAAAHTVAPSTVKVSVLNAGAGNGAAGENAAVLAKAGFSATAANFTGTAPATTTIEYAGGMEAQAKTLAKYVPGAAVRQASVSTVTLVLAGDGVTARSAPAASSSPSASSSAAKPPRKALDAGCIN
jgi:hypothetical protein